MAASKSGSISGTGSLTGQESYLSTKNKPPPLELKTQSSVESNLQTDAVPKTPTTQPEFYSVKEKRIGHRRVDEHTGQVTYKKKTTSDLMKSIQLGIGQSVGSLTSKPTRDVLMADFSVVESAHFPENGSNLTPAHRVGEFRFKTYAPVAFRYFREIFGIRTDDFLVSLCSLPMTELSNPGASGSVFFRTEDDEFIIKTVQHKEAEFLQKLLPGYYMNLNQNPRTLLPKFYGLYCYQSGGKNIRLCVMNNLLPSAIQMSEKYDLKGSTYKRKASKHELSKSSPTYKDLDFKDRHPGGIILEAETYEALIKTIKRDCRVLESFKIMDYSLLLGIYNVDEVKRDKIEELKERKSHSSSTDSAAEPVPSTSSQAAAAAAPSTSAGRLGGASGVAVPGAITRGRSTKARLQQFTTAMESIQADIDPLELEDDDIPPGGIPARNGKGERLLLYMGIIDILQSYRLKKKLEHGFKSIVHDGDSISVHRPSFYAQRFINFFEKDVFKKVTSLDSPTIAGPNARFRKIVHTINFVNQMKKAPNLNLGGNSPAMRSPSKKKATTRQRSQTDPMPAEQKVSLDSSAGMMANRNRPDLIPQQAPYNDASSMYIGLDSKMSQNTISTSAGAYSSSSASTMTGHSYIVTARGESYQALGKLTERTSSVDMANATMDDSSAPMHHDDPLPPYSETYEQNTVTQKTIVVQSESGSVGVSTVSTQMIRAVAPDSTDEGVNTLSPGAALNLTQNSEAQNTKSSFRKEKTERDRSADRTKVHFVSTEENDENSLDRPAVASPDDVPIEIPGEDKNQRTSWIQPPTISQDTEDNSGSPETASADILVRPMNTITTDDKDSSERKDP